MIPIRNHWHMSEGDLDNMYVGISGYSDIVVSGDDEKIEEHEEASNLTYY